MVPGIGTKLTSITVRFGADPPGHFGVCPKADLVDLDQQRHAAFGFSTPNIRS